MANPNNDSQLQLKGVTHKDIKEMEKRKREQEEREKQEREQKKQKEALNT